MMTPTKTNRIGKFINISLLVPVFIYFILFVATSSCQRGDQCVYMENDNVRNKDTKLDPSSITSENCIYDPIHRRMDNLMALGLSPVSSGDTSSTSNNTSLTKIASDDAHMLVSTLPEQAQDLLLGDSDINTNQEVLESKESFEHYSESDHQEWFNSLSMAMEYAESDDELIQILDEGKTKGYLLKPIFWDRKVYTPMHYAAQEGGLTVVKMLEEKYQVPLDTAIGPYKKVPLHLAASRGRLNVVKYLLSENRNWEELLDTDGASALQYAALGTYGKNNVEVVKYLVDHYNASLEEKSHGFNLLYLAIEAKNLDMVDYLLAQYNSLAREAVDGVSPFEYAENQGKSTIAASIACVVAAHYPHQSRISLKQAKR